MSTLKPGWPAKVTDYLLKQTEPVTARKVIAEALGLDSHALTPGEFKAVSGAIHNVGWRSALFWCPPAVEGEWTPELEASRKRKLEVWAPEEAAA
jgi:hypothetical protein